MQEKGLSADKVEGVGLGVPGPVLDSSIVPIVCANLGGWGNRNVSIELSELLGGIRVLVGNDANVAALGEIWMGAAQGCRSAVMVTLGTGVGGAYALVVWGPWKRLGILWKAVILSLSVALFIGVELSVMVGAPFWLTSAGLFVGTFLAVELGNLMISKTALAKVV